MLLLGILNSILNSILNKVNYVCTTWVKFQSYWKGSSIKRAFNSSSERYAFWPSIFGFALNQRDSLRFAKRSQFHTSIEVQFAIERAIWPRKKSGEKWPVEVRDYEVWNSYCRDSKREQIVHETSIEWPKGNTETLVEVRHCSRSTTYTLSGTQRFGLNHSAESFSAIIR